MGAENEMDNYSPHDRSGKMHEQMIEFEKQLRDSQLIRSEGPKLFLRLQECLVRELREANRRAGKNEYRITTLKPRLLDLCRESSIRVERCDRRTQPLTITLSLFIHRMHFECGAKRRDYILTAGDDGNLWFQTCSNIKKTIDEIVVEMLKEVE
jgi:hypothetical protein